MKKTVRDRYYSGLLSNLAMVATLLSTVSLSSAAFAQAAPGIQEDGSGDIMVTARRKSENILRTPISITALTADDIAAKGIFSIQDVAQSTPGLNVQQAATTGGRADRSFTSIQLRGFVPSTSAAQTTSIFIDGAPVSTATALQTLTNPERVEIIKGPQSALFGRQTFAGAVNVVTKAPSDHLTASVAGMAGTRQSYDVQGEISAPIIEDVLSFRASFRAAGKHGSYRNSADGDTLGDQSTKTGSLAILFKPTNNLTFKVFGLKTELDDGPPANGFISSKTVTNSAGQALLTGQSNCNITNSAGVTNAFFCGVAPQVRSISANTQLTPALAAFLARDTGRVLKAKDGVEGYGLVNHYYHVHINTDWALGNSGVTLSALTAWNAERKGELADLDNYYSTSITRPTSAEGFYNFPYMIEGRARDFSQELRASFENGGPLHASAGGSYLVQQNQSDAGSPFLNSLTFAGALQSRTYGVFGSLSYDFSSHFTLSGDARYQIDKLYAFAGQGGIINAAVNIPENGLIVSKVYKNFLPRAIAQYNFDSHSMVYASYSKGVNPGSFNSLFVTSPEPLVRSTATANGFGVAVDPEKITNYEIGSKGRIFGGKVRYDAAAYVAIWTNQIQNQSLTVFKTIADAGPAPLGSALQVSASVNTGSVRVSGLEANFGIDLAPGLTVDLAGAYVRTFILKATNLPVSAFYNISSFRGKENPFVSKWSGTAAVNYVHAINDEFDGFGRVDFSYKSGGYADIANVVRAPDMNQVNLRLGVRNKKYSIEGFVTNLFNNKAYYNVGTSGLIAQNQAGAVAAGTYGALVAQLRDLRTAGVRGSLNF
jgi:iron complex outermembrane receptor protein